jgi:hypothetical protein
MKQTGFAIITRVERDHLTTLNERIGHIKEEGHPAFLDFNSVPGLHFASIVLCVDPDDRFDPFLVFEHNIDGTSDSYLQLLYERVAPSLRHIYECCLGYPLSAGTDRDALLDYLRQHVYQPNAILMGKVGGAVETILREEVLHDRVQEFLGQRRACAHAAHIKAEIEEFVDRERLLDGLPEQRVGLLRRIWNSFRLRTWAVDVFFSPSWRFGVFVVGVLAIAYCAYAFFWVRIAILGLVAFAIVWLTILKLTDRRDPPFSLDAKRTRKLVEAEAFNTTAHNHLAITAIVKPGRMRLLNLRFVLWLINLLTRGIGKPDIGIHFAQWTIVRDRRCNVLLFLSNYDGGWAQYLDMFIDRGHVGINAIWGNALHFPRTKFLLLGGARDGRRLKDAIRAYQHAASIWYTAYPYLPVKNVDNNSQIRNQIRKKLSATDINEWLLRF